MTKENQIEIPLSKSKMILTFLGSLIFVLIGIWFLLNPPKSNHWFFGNEIVIFVFGLAAILFFGLVAVTIFRKLLDKKPGLIINSQGIIDNSSGISAGLIPWTDIQQIKTVQVMSQRFLMFTVKNPQDYLDKASTTLKRNAMKVNYKTYGAPISISSNALKINFDELHKMLLEKMSENKS